MGIKIEEDFIYTLLFADDQLILAEDKEDVIYMIRKLIEEYVKWGLELNMDKTQYIAISTTKTDIQAEFGSIKRV